MAQPVDQNRSLVLETAWQRYAEFDANALDASRLHLKLRWWVIILAVAATLLAILTDLFGNPLTAPVQLFGNQTPLLAQILKIGLILVPIVSSVILTFANKMQQGERWLTLRTGAEEIIKEIYFYRTVLQQQEGRDQWLNDRVTAIQRQVFEGMGGDLVLKPYSGSIPPYYYPANPDSDPGFSDLLAEEYLRCRLGNQLNFHSDKIQQMQTARMRLQVGIFIAGGVGTFLAALANINGLAWLSVWVALTTSIAAALTAWLELRRLDSTINNYGKVILELKVIQDHWRSLPTRAQTGDEFFKLVTAAEQVLWSQHSQYISEMRRAVAELQGQDSDLLARVMNTPASPSINAALLEEARKAAISLAQSLPHVKSAGDLVTAVETVVEEMTQGVAKAAKPAPAEPLPTPVVTPSATTEVAALPPVEGAAKPVEPITSTSLPEVKTEPPRLPKGLPHAFVVMPFGCKQGADGRRIDFNSVYQDLIKPALTEAGFEPFRADEESVSGDILTDMFQELLLADLVIADLSIDNANVFYELGVRHALRKRGLVHIQSGRAYLPFDIFNVRTIPYHLDKNGRPDLEFLDKDRQTIAKITRETYASNLDRIHSPIFNLLDGLKEPDRKSLQTPLATGYWREHQKWHDRVEIAQRQKRIGDVLLLTEEVSNPLIKEEVIVEAGKALRGLGRYELALQQYRQGLAINPYNTEFRREEAFHLSRMHRYDEAIVKLERLLQDQPEDIESISYLGRIYKEMWAEEWNNIEDARQRQDKAYQTAYWLRKSFETYLSGYRLDQNYFYAGINAFMLAVLLDNLTNRYNEPDDADLITIRHEMELLKASIQFCLKSYIQRHSGYFWALISLADLSVCIADDPKVVTRAYQKAITVAGQNRFGLKSSLSQLELLAALDFRPEFVEAGINVLRAEVDKLAQESEEDKMAGAGSRKVFLFSGHMIDRPGRLEPRFPMDMEAEATRHIEEAMEKLEATTDDMAITAGAACGGDILFIEACLKHNMRVEVLLPFSEAKFIEESVSFAGDEWVTRFYNIRNHPNVTFRQQTDHVGPLPSGDNAYERNNRWALYSALIYGIDRVRLMALWNGKGGDGPGGTGHMVAEVRRLGGIAEHLDTTKFDYWQHQGKGGDSL